ncbi:MAG: rod shape-determining protein MreC [Anaerolineae bacterium]|nr:rod shape-determining protein MreC [Anaerolineae bacterium]
MEGLRKSRAVPYLLIAATFLAIVLHEVGYLQPVEDIVLRLISPVQSRFNTLAHGVGEALQTLRDLGTLRQENARLRRENDALTIENVQLKEAEAENERLRHLLDFARANPTYDYRGGEVVARVIGHDPSIYLDFIVIDLGERQGVRSGMPVVTERGLVGRIAQVHDTTAEVLLITDVNSAVTALVQNSRATGVVRGVAGGGLLLDQVPQDVAIHEGEIVITSGMGGVFPKGLVIGQISKVYQQDYEMFQQARVRPTVDFRNLEQVLVITNFTPLADLRNLPEETETR